MNTSNIIKKNTSNVTQAVISLDQQFILAKKMNDFVDIICPFTKIDGEFYTNFFLPLNQLHRIQALYEVMSDIAKYTVSDNMISFDCVRKLPDDMFGDAEAGYIHYTFMVEKKKQNQVEIIVEPQIVFQNIESEPITITFNQKVKFKSDYLKVFPIVLKSGFIFSTVDKQICRIFISVMKPSERFIGDCSKYEISNVIQYLLPLWSIFDINIGKNIYICLREDFIGDILKDISTPMLISASYNLDNPEIVTINKIGKHVKLENI